MLHGESRRNEKQKRQVPRERVEIVCILLFCFFSLHRMSQSRRAAVPRQVLAEKKNQEKRQSGSSARVVLFVGAIRFIWELDSMVLGVDSLGE